MNSHVLNRFLGQLGQMLALRRRTWIALGLGLLAMLVLAGWAITAALGWLIGHAPAAADAGRRAAQVVMQDASQALPEVARQVEAVLPGAVAQVEALLPGVHPAPAREAGGRDIGPVARYPGLARDLYSTAEGQERVAYLGGGDFDAVLAHYAQGFHDQGWRQEIVSAGVAEEHRRYSRGAEVIDLRLARQDDGRLRLELLAPQ